MNQKVNFATALNEKNWRHAIFLEFIIKQKEIDELFFSFYEIFFL